MVDVASKKPIIYLDIGAILHGQEIGILLQHRPLPDALAGVGVAITRDEHTGPKVGQFRLTTGPPRFDFAGREEFKVTLVPPVAIVGSEKQAEV